MTDKKREHPTGSVLRTRDGRVVGNAIIDGHEGVYNLIKTDFGNLIRLTDDEVKELFHDTQKT
ncbi:MAG: hypothetical protein V4721_10580 [Bacteroidota bacterium]